MSDERAGREHLASFERPMNYERSGECGCDADRDTEVGRDLRGFSVDGDVRSDVNPSRRGDVSESVVLSALMRQGVSVSVPFGDSDRYDLVVDDAGTLLRVQCKTGSWVNGTVRFKLYSSTVEEGERVDRSYSSAGVDAFAVYSPRTEDVYWVPFEATGSGEMRLRVTEPDARAPRSRINWAREFRLADRFA